MNPTTKTPDSAPPQRILLVRLSHLGDACHGLAVYHAVRDRFPAAELWWAIQPEFAGLLKNLPQLAGVVHFDRRGGWRAWPRIRRAMRSVGFDWAIDAQGNWKSALVTHQSGARYRLGMAPKDWREPSAARCMNHWAAQATGPHAMHRMQALGAAIGYQGPVKYHLPLTAAEHATGSALLREALNGQSAAGGRILHLATLGDPRSWPAECFLSVARDLAARGCPTLLLSGPSEQAQGERLRQAAGQVANLHHVVGQRGLRELASLFANAADQGMRLLACDSGPSHVAAAVGLPVDLLAGPTDPSRTGPWPYGPSPPGHRTLWMGPNKPLAQLEPKRVLAWLLEAGR
ncbi:MAG: glycosyltransferase family 9 protein [Planctomycetes bacterium]|nr:glycosyltransferase family 9 protein [Planctomycetota bacterium]MCB9910722.1 glycosyltransferase family 9 protein [Planctomycetota bacterium]MCB9912748.1 glycosyltransferase family 9 protein [Planctomycetota bacterium]HPF14647.1 glycosyltransferase family 9 protein [Planctomycetota bacterium]